MEWLKVRFCMYIKKAENRFLEVLENRELRS